MVTARGWIDYDFIQETCELMHIDIREYRQDDVSSMVKIWNEVVHTGDAFPQEDCLTIDTGRDFFGTQTYCGVAEDVDSMTVVGLYILHPNNIGRCGHIGNASYAVRSDKKGQHIGEKLVLDSLIQAKKAQFTILQFNAVVASNIHAIHLYERLGFQKLGMVPAGFRMKDGHFEAIYLYYKTL